MTYPILSELTFLYKSCSFITPHPHILPCFLPLSHLHGDDSHVDIQKGTTRQIVQDVGLGGRAKKDVCSTSDSQKKGNCSCNTEEKKIILQENQCTQRATHKTSFPPRLPAYL